jgi:hypothetical protein
LDRIDIREVKDSAQKDAIDVYFMYPEPTKATELFDRLRMLEGVESLRSSIRMSK